MTKNDPKCSPDAFLATYSKKVCKVPSRKKADFGLMSFTLIYGRSRTFMGVHARFTLFHAVSRCPVFETRTVYFFPFCLAIFLPYGFWLLIGTCHDITWISVNQRESAWTLPDVNTYSLVSNACFFSCSSAMSGSWYQSLTSKQIYHDLCTYMVHIICTGLIADSCSELNSFDLRFYVDWYWPDAIDPKVAEAVLDLFGG